MHKTNFKTFTHAKGSTVEKNLSNQQRRSVGGARVVLWQILHLFISKFHDFSKTLFVYSNLEQILCGKIGNIPFWCKADDLIALHPLLRRCKPHISTWNSKTWSKLTIAWIEFTKIDFRISFFHSPLVHSIVKTSQVIILSVSTRLKTCELDLTHLLRYQAPSQSNAAASNSNTVPGSSQQGIESESGRAVDNQYSFV